MRMSGAAPGGVGGAPAPEEVGPGPEVERRAPDTPTELTKRAWLGVLKGALREFKDDELTNRAAALPYYGVLSLFPALLALVSVLGITGESTTDAVLADIEELAPGSAREVAGPGGPGRRHDRDSVLGVRPTRR
ncbi:hypothetical protein Srubr_35930 [Streptomyces rubradiris]|uniref:Uncharacterized protein n=1 Tax=Streptomyces rubradiris TaxID=285531 RepID=A0ABQ3RD77_STRRR|nr:hypothetical protein GCM10018792_04850 [Streptomyces rubradiris]GHI53747.1 hypothetical protein Srubr_35930 [Streptomyces rubradiris]